VVVDVIAWEDLTAIFVP